MNDQHEHRIILTDGQKRKLRIAYKKRRPVVIGLKNEAISSGGEKILLSTTQYKLIKKALKNKTGVRLVLGYDQLLKNKEGGFLKEMLELIETSVPGGKTIISPLVRQQVAPLLKNHFIPWLKNLIDNELESVIKGAGLKKVINKKLDALLKKTR